MYAENMKSGWLRKTKSDCGRDRVVALAARILSVIFSVYLCWILMQTYISFFRFRSYLGNLEDSILCSQSELSNKKHS